MEWNKPLDTRVLEGDLNSFKEPVLLHKVNETILESFWDLLVKEYHYLGYGSVIGGRVKYLITLGTRLVGAISFCSGAYKLGQRDLFIGWDEETKLGHLPHLLNNNRFLILPWIRVHNLASHTLALSLKQVRVDWEIQYGIVPYMVETFVDRDKFKGTCYLAANWICLGATKGFGRLGNSFVYHGHTKDLYVYVLNRRFKQIFRPNLDRLPNERCELLKLITNRPLEHKRILKENGVYDISSATFSMMLAEHIERYVNYLGSKQNKPHFVAVVKGLLSDLERKSLGPISKAFESDGELRNITNFMRQSLVDNESMLRVYNEDLSGLLSHSEGMITGDACDFVRYSKKSAGVDRQFSYSLGKYCNCQASVMVGYSSLEGYGMIDCSLYMPKHWFGVEFAELREKCFVPESLKFMTKNHMLLGMIKKAKNSGKFMFKYIGVDASFGDDFRFLDSIPKGLIYFAEISETHQIFAKRPDMNAHCYDISGGAYSISTAPFLATNVKDVVRESKVPWNNFKVDIGNNNLIIAADKCFKVVECRDGNPGLDVWLYARRMKDESIKYALCNESMQATTEMIRAPALLRLQVTSCIKECRERFGMDHYEIRSWPGWRRHMLFTFIAHLFTVKLHRNINII
jgi:SRSO17 transposase